ncbi:Ig-like domain-containing protein [Staphylococcus aureus]
MGNPNFGQLQVNVLKLKANYTISDLVKEGDTFTFKYGRYLRSGSGNNAAQNQNLYNAQEYYCKKVFTIVKQYNKCIVFTNYVDQYTNVSGSFEQVSFAKSETQQLIKLLIKWKLH